MPPLRCGSSTFVISSHTEEGACSSETFMWKIYGMSSVIVVFDFQFE